MGYRPGSSTEMQLFRLLLDMSDQSLPMNSDIFGKNRLLLLFDVAGAFDSVDQKELIIQIGEALVSTGHIT